MIEAIEQVDFLTTRQNQTDAILEYLKTHHSITQLTADDLGVKRLAARIGDLKHFGYEFDVKMVKVQGRHGATRVAEYSLLQNRSQND